MGSPVHASFRLGGWGHHNSPMGDFAYADSAAFDAAGTAIVTGREVKRISYSQTSSRIWSSRHAPGAGWGPPVYLEEPTEYSSRSVVSVDRSGNAIAVWSRLIYASGTNDATIAEIWSNWASVGAGWGSPVRLESGPRIEGGPPGPASSGIGEATAERLAATGYKVFGPAYTKTPFDAHFVEPDATLDEYREVRAVVKRRVQEVMATADEPRVVADVVLRAATAARPKVRYTAGGVAGRLRFLRRFLPAGLMDAGIRRDLRLDAPAAAASGAKQ